MICTIKSTDGYFEEYEREISTVEDLKGLMETYGKALIISMHGGEMEIEVYDGYRE